MWGCDPLSIRASAMAPLRGSPWARPSRLVLLACLLAPSLAFAEAGGEAGATTDARETVSTLAQTVRWSGVLASLGVVVATSIILRFLDRLTKGAGDSFSDTA